MDNSTLFKVGYGLYVLSARDKDKDNGCIINTVMQATDTPLRLLATINKQSYTGELISRSGEFNVSILSESAKFPIYKTFGFKSGRDINKFENIPFKRSSNGITYLQGNTCGVISCKVVNETDLGTHTLMLADITDAKLLSNEEPVTYLYYQKNIRPKPEKKNKKGWRCEVCGYVYEGEELPDDFICPICKHGVNDFVRIE